MDTKKNKFKISLFLIGNISFATADDNALLRYVENTISDSRVESILPMTGRPKVNPVILKDSFVVLNRAEIFSNIAGTKRVGKFVYELQPGKLHDKLTQDQAGLNSVKALPIDTGYRLVQIPGKNFLISDGSFIIRFKNPRNKEELALDYNLNPKYQMPDATSYVSKDFSGLEGLIKRIEADPRVLSVELDLIDPYIQLQ
tara:strand:- start:13 stop:612 length:600 start_codon:yes stop_codon:yes gene_type:complete